MSFLGTPKTGPKARKTREITFFRQKITKMTKMTKNGTFWLSEKVSKMALFLVQEAENEFRGTPRQRGPKWGHFWGSLLGPLF